MLFPSEARFYLGSAEIIWFLWAFLVCLLKDRSCSLQWLDIQCVKHGQLLSWSSYHSTVELIQFAPKVKPCIGFKTSPFFLKLEIDFFSTATNIKLGFLSYGTFTEINLAMASLDLTHPWNSFSQSPKWSHILGSWLLGPLLASAILDLVGYLFSFSSSTSFLRLIHL